MADQDDATSGADHRPPFASPGQGFFTGADRQTHLEQLRHLSQWSRRVLLVTGPRGVGKSTLYRQLSAGLEPRAKAARINAALVNGSRDVLNAMVQGFGLAAPAGADATLLSALVTEHAEAQERAERLCVVLVDDAELLESRTLEHLLVLTAAAPLRLVLFGEIRLVPAVERAAAASGTGWHEIRLSGFTVEDVRRYLAWRLDERGFTGGLPFTDAQVREITRLSEGLPGRIDPMANVLLAKIQSGGPQSASRRLPAMHQGLLAVLIVFLTILYVIWPTAEDVARTADVERVAVPPPAPRQAPEGAPAADPTGRAAPAAGQPDLAQRPAPDPAQAPAADIEAPAADIEAPAADVEAPAADVEAPAADIEAPAADIEAPAADIEAPAADIEAPAATGKEPAAAETAADRTQPALDTPPPTETPARAEPGPTPSDGPAARDAAWIMRQPASNYTLQLVIFSTAERTAEYLASQEAVSSFARFRIQQDGRILHVVLYGSFESRADAEQAAARLPATVGNVKPWIRTFGPVQERVRSALQQ